MKLCRWVFGPLIVGVIGLLVAIPLANDPQTRTPAVVLAVGAGLGALIGFAIAPGISKLIWRIDYRSQR